MTALHDPYDYPFPSRKDLMSLSTISLSYNNIISNLIDQQDTGFNKIRVQNKDNFRLKVDDILGAQPCIKSYKYTNKQDYTNLNKDIQGSSPKQRTRNYDRPVLHLENKDIKGTQPQINKFITTRQSSNPLEPVYKLPLTEQRQPTPPKFIRDSIECRDIEGTKPLQNSHKLRKDVVVYEEIEGSRPKPRFIPRDHIEIMDVKDINSYLQFKTKRVINPLEPKYVVQNENGEKIEIGQIDGSKSRRLHPLSVNKTTSMNLLTQDVKGAQAGTHSDYFLKTNTRKDFRSINETKDVPGSQVGSLKKGMTTIRQTNPIVPNYQIPGHKEIYHNLPGNNNSTNKVFASTANANLTSVQSQQVSNFQYSNRPSLTKAQKLDGFIDKK